MVWKKSCNTSLSPVKASTSSFRAELRVKRCTCVDEHCCTPVKYHCTRTSFSLGCGALDNAQKLPFQCAPTSVHWPREDNPMALAPAGDRGYVLWATGAVPGQRHSPLHTASEEIRSKVFRCRVLKFKLIFSFRIHSWKKEAEREHR